MFITEEVDNHDGLSNNFIEEPMEGFGEYGSRLSKMIGGLNSDQKKLLGTAAIGAVGYVGGKYYPELTKKIKGYESMYKNSAIYKQGKKARDEAKKRAGRGAMPTLNMQMPNRVPIQPQTGNKVKPLHVVAGSAVVGAVLWKVGLIR